MPRQKNDQWPAHLEAKLRILWNDEGKSATQIARELGNDISRSAVLGKARRLNLARHDGIQQPRMQPRIVIAKPVTAKPREPVMPKPEGPVSLRIMPVNIGSKQCRWIHGDPQIDPSMCGHFAPNGPYCDYHQRIAFPHKAEVAA